MAAAISQPVGTLDLVRSISSRTRAVILLQAFALTLFVIPSDTVIKAIGAGGYAAALIGMFAFAAYLAVTLLGLHNPLAQRHPIRAVLCLLWLSVLASYVLMDRTAMTVPELASADRLLMQLAVISGVALIAAEFLGSVDDVRRVLRVVSWGGAFCGAVAGLQFWLSLDLSTYLRELPGFSINVDDAAILARGGLNRVSGTSIYPIELGVVAGMLLPLAIYLALYDTDRSARRRWAPVGLIALAIPASVSRSGVLSVALALGVLVVLMPAPQRLVALGALPLGLVVVFMSAPGLIGTLSSFFGAGTSDASVATRVSDYPLVERSLEHALWFGQGGWTYLPNTALDILDNQYLKTAIELGVVGVIALTAFFLVPTIAALVARRRSRDPELRLLCAALAGSALAATACSFTFDSLSYPMFTGLYALVIGLIGAVWRLTAGSEAPGARADTGSSAIGSVPRVRAPLPAGG
ncbi:MAG TPA: O-antigen ligase family protein [Solirubrobacterales bacterium]|jgi:O-antigen ligase|nr:O-antigen ligase family protein [Solirubrobacterales bacterium]